MANEFQCLHFMKNRFEIQIRHLGRNHDGVITRRGIISHHPREEKPRESFLLINALLGNEAQTLREHLPQFRQPTCSLNSHIILV